MMEPTPELQPARPRATMSVLLTATALIAASAALVAQIVRDSGSWRVALMMLGTNAFLCMLLRVAARFRLVPLLVMFSTAALTETVLWRVAIARRNTDWIVAIAVLGGVILLAIELALRASRRET